MTNADLRGLTDWRENIDDAFDRVANHRDRHKRNAALAVIRAAYDAALSRLPADAGAVAWIPQLGLDVLAGGEPTLVAPKAYREDYIPLFRNPDPEVAEWKKISHEWAITAIAAQDAAPPSPPVAKDDARSYLQIQESGACKGGVTCGFPSCDCGKPADDARDAARYRWLRNPGEAFIRGERAKLITGNFDTDLDAAIDAAINASMGGEKT